MGSELITAQPGRGDLFRRWLPPAGVRGPTGTPSQPHPDLAGVVQGLLSDPFQLRVRSPRADRGRECVEVGGKLLEDSLTVWKERANLFLWPLLEVPFPLEECMEKCESLCV